MKHKIMIPLILTAATLGTVLNAQQSAAPTGEKPAFYESFDNWEWVPINARAASTYKTMKQKGHPFCVEIDGATAKNLKGGYDNTGLMTTGKDAFKGNAMRYQTGPKNDRVWGFHKRKLLIKPNKQYKYEVYLKGKGLVNLYVWREGINAQGKKNFIGLVSLFSINVNSTEWKKYSGSYTIPPNKDKVYSTYEKGFIWALYFYNNSDVYIDELKIFEADIK